MQLSLLTKIKIAAYVIKSMITKPTFSKFNPDDAKDFYVSPHETSMAMIEHHPMFFCPQIAGWVCSIDRDSIFEMAKSNKFSLNFNDWMFAPKPKPDNDKDALDKLLSGLLMSLTPEDHQRTRRLVQPAFLPKNIAKI